MTHPDRVASKVLLLNIDLEVGSIIDPSNGSDIRHPHLYGRSRNGISCRIEQWPIIRVGSSRVGVETPNPIA